MSVQTNYGFSSAKGIAGGLYDLSAHEVATRQAEGGNLSFGVGVVLGTNKGIDVAIPSSTMSSNDFEGVVVHNSVMVEMDKDGKVLISDKATVGCLHYGKIWVKTGAKANPTYKAKVYLIIDGDEAGLFTTADDTTTTKVETDAIFLGEVDEGIANAEFYSTAVTLPVTETKNE